MQQEMGRSYWKTSAADIWFRRVFKDLLADYSRGELLDAGAGNLLYRNLLEDYCDSYEALDINDAPNIEYVQDLQNTDLDSDSYDTVFCRNVLEHLQKPRSAMSEISRLLRDDGTAIVSVPHLAYLHNEPEDYYRFTQYGLEEIVSDTKLEVIETRRAGGFFSFLGYIFSTFFVGLTYGVPTVSLFTLRINSLIQRTFYTADKLLKTGRYLPLNYVAVFQKND
jgi:SAM-dependent methyltransferase